MITQVVDHKADIVLIELETASRYMEKNPVKIRRIGGKIPIRFYGIGYDFPFEAPWLHNAFLAAIRELVDGNDVGRSSIGTKQHQECFIAFPHFQSLHTSFWISEHTLWLITEKFAPPKSRAMISRNYT